MPRIRKDTRDVICDRCGCEASGKNWIIEFEGKNTCKGCLEAIVRKKGWISVNDTPCRLCPICELPMTKYDTFDGSCFHCEDCGMILWM